MIKKTLIILSLLLITSSANALELLIKVGSKYPFGHPLHNTGWQDGDIIDIRPSGFYGTGIGSHRIIDFPNINYWVLRGDTNWKSTKPSVLNLKKFLSKADTSGKYRWEDGFDENTTSEGRRDYFVDFKDFANKGGMTQKEYNDLYNGKLDKKLSVDDLSITTKLKNVKTGGVRLDDKK